MNDDIFDLEFCFICGSVENENGCTNKDCPRFEINKPADTTATKATTAK